MTQHDVEAVLGRLITDEAFRDVFFRNARRACLEAGLHIAPDQEEALLAISPKELARLSEILDGRICRFRVLGDADESDLVR